MFEFLVYGLHWLFVISALVISWRRGRHHLHPHFMFTVMICVLLSDFLVRGYDDQSFDFIPEEDVQQYQIIVLAILSVIVFVTAFVRAPNLEARLHSAARSLYISPRVRRLIALAAISILAADLIKRFSTVGWSLDEVIRQSMAPRGDRAWDQAQFAGNAVFALINILLPISALTLAYFVATGRGLGRLVSLAIYSLVIAMLVTDGSRTPVALSLGTLAFFMILKQRSFAKRIVTVCAIGTIMVVLFSAMYLYRSSGYLDDHRMANQQSFAITYHQDDSYYRAIAAYAHSDHAGQKWSPWFFFTAIAANPIPRAFWPGKPLFTQEFYGGFKLDYVTISFLGEMVAMTGVELSILVSPLVGIGLYLILFNSMRLLNYPFGLGAYLLMALYTYMCIRGLPNLTMFMYLPAFGVLLVLVLSRMRNSRRSALQMQPTWRARRSAGPIRPAGRT